MDSASIKTYDIQLVVDCVDIGGTTGKVLSIECCESRMFLGTAEGFLLEYFMTDERSKTFFSRVRQSNLNKAQPIVQMRSASALDSLIILTGTTLAMYDIQSLEVKGSNTLSGVSCFAIDENPFNDDPFAVTLCFVKRKSLIMAVASEKGFNVVKEISLDATALNLAVESGLVCAALSSGRYVFADMNAQKKTVAELCQFDPKDVIPKIVNAGKEEFLLIGPGGLGVFTSSSGISERPPIIWHETVNEIVVDGLNVVAAGNDVIYVNSLHDPTTSNVIPFPGVKCLALTEGKLYVGTARSLYRFAPISVDEQVESLINTEKIDQALNLLEMAHVKDDKREFLRRKILRKAVFLRMAVLDLTACIEAIQESHIDLREIVSLFPSILPSNTTFTRSLPSLHEYIDVNQMVSGDLHKARTLASFLLDVLTTNEAMPESKDLSTSAIKLAAKYDKSKFIIILDLVSCMNIDYDDCFEWMEENKYHDCLALLYKAKGDSRKALDVWIDLLNGCRKCEDPDEFEGVDVIVETLLSSTNVNLIWEYYEKLSKHDPVKAVEIFTKREPSSAFQPLEVAEKLSSNRSICMIYLRNCIFDKNMEDEDLHTYLATLYIDSIQESIGEESEGLRTQFRQLLISSNSLKVQFLIGRLQKTQLRLELAILHGKAGDHDPALKVIVEELRDYEFASEYCGKISDPGQRENAFMSLLKLYLKSKDDPDTMDACRKLLTNYAEEFDFSVVLPELPEEWGVRSLADLLHRVLRTHLHRDRREHLIKGLTERINKDYKLELEANNQGYILDDESVCGVCSRKFDSLEPVNYKKGFIVHSKCV